MEVYEEMQPLFVVVSDSVDHCVRQCVYLSQRERMKYIVHFSGRHIVTNSTQVIAQLKIMHMLENDNAVDKESWKGEVKPGVHFEDRGDELVESFERQAEYDDKQLFLCGMDSGSVDSEELERAVQGTGSAMHLTLTSWRRLGATSTIASSIQSKFGRRGRRIWCMLAR